MRLTAILFAALLIATASGAFAQGHGPIPPQNDSVFGDKTTHIYNPPGDNDWPLAKNRVYFDTEAKAIAAGYHKRGTPAPAASKTAASKKKTGKKANPSSTAAMKMSSK